MACICRKRILILFCLSLLIGSFQFFLIYYVLLYLHHVLKTIRLIPCKVAFVLNGTLKKAGNSATFKKLICLTLLVKKGKYETRKT